jgi:Transposase IS4
MWCKYTNQRALIANAGIDIYQDFKPFTPREIEKHLAIYFVNGLNPSPQVEMKFRQQAFDPIQGNDFVWKQMGPGAKARHKHFKAFLCIQDPMKPAPTRKENPLHKVNSFLRWIQQVSQAAWKIGRNLSGDEQTIGFQGNHSDKRRITYKAEGDGFQCDAICDRGFTYNFYFRNMPPPPNYVQQGWSPLHARMLSLFDCFDEKYHRVWMDNLYLSAKFCKGCYNHASKVLIAGVARKSGRGIPDCVIQEEVKNKKDITKVRGTIKAAVLKGDRDCPDLIALSMYDSKPVNFLSMVAEEIKWIECKKKVYCKDTGKNETMKFLRLSINNDYNYNMNDVDCADQLRNNYRFDHWMRKRKWWWAIFFWGVGVLKVNAYVSYLTFHLMHGKKRNEILSHYEFREQIALAWLDPNEYWPDRYIKVLSQKRSFDSIASSVDTGRQTRSSKMQQHVEPVVKRAKKLTDASLNASEGALKCRLNHSIPHWPLPKKSKKAKCALHYWAAGVEDRAQIVKCSVCDVHLCVSCFQIYHTTHHLMDEKDNLFGKFLDKKMMSSPAKSKDDESHYL